MDKSELNKAQIFTRDQIVKSLKNANWEDGDENDLFEKGEWVEYEASFSFENEVATIYLDFSAESDDITLRIVEEGGDFLEFIILFDDYLTEFLDCLTQSQKSITIRYFRPFFKKLANFGIRSFLIQGETPVAIIRDDVNQIEKLKGDFENRGWVISEWLEKNHLNEIVSMSDLEATFFNKDFKIHIQIFFDQQFLIQEISRLNSEQLYSHLYFYSKNLTEFVAELLLWSEKLTSKTYSGFVEQMIPLCKLVLFNDNGVLSEVNLKN